MTQRFFPVTLDSIRSLGDNVFGFSMTLLAVQIAIPEAADPTPLATLAHEWPRFVAYLSTFALLGTLWYAFHVDLRYLRRIDRHFVLLQFPLLFIATLQPFAAGLFGNFLGQTVGVMVPSLSVLAFFLLLWARWSYMTHGRRLVGPDLHEGTIRATHFALASLVGLSAVSLSLAFVFPWLSLAVFGLGGAAFYVGAIARRVWPGAIAAQPAEESIPAPSE